MNLKNRISYDSFNDWEVENMQKRGKKKRGMLLIGTFELFLKRLNLLVGKKNACDMKKAWGKCQKSLQFKQKKKKTKWNLFFFQSSKIISSLTFLLNYKKVI